MAANTGQTGPDDIWLATLQEEVLEPTLPIIDPHHHLWVRSGYTYLMPELAADLESGHNIVATVFAECHSMYRKEGPKAERSLGETEFVRGQAAMSASGTFGRAGACDVMFGNVDLTLGSAVEPILEQHIAASGGRFRGVRISSGWHADEKVGNVTEQPNLLIDPRVSEAAAVLSRMGLSLDCWLYHPQLDEVAQLADAHPGLTIILNHVGSPILGGPYRGKSDEVFKDMEGRYYPASAGANNVFVSNSAHCRFACQASGVTAVCHLDQKKSPPHGALGWRPASKPLALLDLCMSQIFRYRNVGVVTRSAGTHLSESQPAHQPVRKLICLLARQPERIG